MQVFKFGGASVKNANSVRNLVTVLEKTGHNNTIIITSAMGKMTNALEDVVAKYFNKNNDLMDSLGKVEQFHKLILIDLFVNKSHSIFKEVDLLFDDLNIFLKTNKSPDYNFIYDQIIGFGELLSTTIISAFLNKKGFKNEWLDVRPLVKTDNYYRCANVDWEATQKAINNAVNKEVLYITQGFLGSDANNFTTTLGREGSDYTAAIFGYCLNAKTVTIWKDVPGVLNADPRYFNDTQLLENISYTEAIELAFYGASVIHPKTLRPLQKLSLIHI